MNDNVFYFRDLNIIGGIETFFYQLGLKYGKDFDITVYYRTGNSQQVEKLSKVVRVRRFCDGQKIRCKRAFLCFSLDIIDNIEAEEYYQMLHGDYTAIKVFPDRNPKIQKRIAVSNVVSDSYRDYIGDDSEVCYNPYTPVKPKKVLRLMSATRLTAEKGFNRMKILAAELDKAGVPYIWDIYTDSTQRFDNPSVYFRKPRLDIVDIMADADYFVQLSDTEGYCYSIVEALCAGTPVIVTDFKVAHEIGVKDRVNGFILPMDMNNLPIKELYKGLKKFAYKPMKDHWDKLLVPKGPNETEETQHDVMVRCKKIYFDIEFGTQMSYGQTWTVPEERAYKLFNMGLVDIISEE